MQSTKNQTRPATPPRRLVAIALIFALTLGPDMLLAQSRKASKSRSTEDAACEKEELPLTVRDGLALIRVSINQKPLTFVVDSGGKTIVNSDRILLPVIQQIRTGLITVYQAEPMEVWNVVRVKSFAVGAAELRDSNILSRSLQFFESKLGQEIGGILGNDALRLWDFFSLDYKHKVLVLQRWNCTEPPNTDSLFRLQQDALRLGR